MTRHWYQYSLRSLLLLPVLGAIICIWVSSHYRFRLDRPALCKSVSSFGSFVAFPQNGFSPSGEFILYVEVKNFTAVRKPTGYETRLKAAYEIVDSHGRVVTSHALDPMVDRCGFLRKDFYCCILVPLPAGIAPGQYLLNFHLTDTTTGRQDVTSVSFCIIPGTTPATGLAMPGTGTRAPFNPE